MTKTNYYAVLEVNETATLEEIKSAFRKLAQQYHPDHNNGNETAAAKFRVIKEAYEILGNKEKRTKYDHDLTFERYSFNSNSSNSYFRDAFSTYEREMDQFGHANRNQRQHDKSLDVVVVYPEKISLGKLMQGTQEFTFKYQTSKTDITIGSRSQLTDHTKTISLNIIKTPPKYDSAKNEYYYEFFELGKGNTRSFTMVIDMARGVMSNTGFGNLIIRIPIDVPAHITIDNGWINHEVNVSIFDLLFQEKLLFETIYGKKGEVKIKSFKSFGDIRVPVPESGLNNFNGERMPYTFTVKVAPLDLEKLSSKDRSTFRKLLEKMA